MTQLTPERSPPHDLEAEAAALGSCILDNETIPCVLRVVKARDFYREAHRFIYQAIESLWEDGKPADAIMVREELRRLGQLDAAGGPEGLTALWDKTPTAANAESYARIVAEHAARRRMIAYADAVLRQGYDATEPAEQFVAKAQEALSRFARESFAPPPVRRFRKGSQILLDTGDEGPPWVCEWVIARGLVTLLSGVPKGGKSTFLAALLGCVLRGEPFADLPVERSGVVYVSEEDASTLKDKIRRFGLEDAHYLTRSELFPKPSFTELVSQVAAVAHQEKASVIVFDTLAALAGMGRDAEKDAGAMQEVADQVLALAREGFAVVLVHHLKKGDESEEGEGARGSSALTAAVDIIAELRRVKDNKASPARELRLFERFEGAPAEPICLELGARAYRLVGDPEALRLKMLKDRLLRTLRDVGGGPVKRQDLADSVKGNAQGLGLALDAMVAEGLVTRTGAGKPGNPFVFVLSDAGRDLVRPLGIPTQEPQPETERPTLPPPRELFDKATSPTEPEVGPVADAGPQPEPERGDGEHEDPPAEDPPAEDMGQDTERDTGAAAPEEEQPEPGALTPVEPEAAVDIDRDTAPALDDPLAGFVPDYDQASPVGPATTEGVRAEAPEPGTEGDLAWLLEPPPDDVPPAGR